LAQEDLFLEISKGNIYKHKPVKVSGYNPAIAGAEEDIWASTGVYTGFNSIVAERVSVVSTVGADSLLGTGARLVQLFGLDANWNFQTEIIAMSGAAPVLSVNSYIRAPRLVVRTAGTGGTNAGTITYNQAVTVANVFGVILPGIGESQNMVYSMPDGFDGYLLSYRVSVGGLAAAFADIRLYTRRFGEAFCGRELWGSHSEASSPLISPPMKLYLPPKSDIKFAAIASGACSVGGSADILEIERWTQP